MDTEPPFARPHHRLRGGAHSGMGPSSSLDRLDVADGYVFGDPPRIWPHGARNAARPTFSTGFQGSEGEQSGKGGAAINPL